MTDGTMQVYLSLEEPQEAIGALNFVDRIVIEPKLFQLQQTIRSFIRHNTNEPLPHSSEEGQCAVPWA
jgi:hypothetical protein